MTLDGVHPDDMPDELDAFLDDLRTAASAAPDPVVGAALATLFREGSVPMPAPVPRRRVAVRATVAGVVAGLAFGGLGVAGALPAPVQRRVADVVDHVGVHLPDARPATTTSTVPPTTSTTSTTPRPVPVPATRPPATPPTTADDHGGGPGRSGEDHGRSDEAPGRTKDDDGSGSGKGKGSGKDDGEDDATESSSGRGGPGRNPIVVRDVHGDEGSNSGPQDDGGHG